MKLYQVYAPTKKCTDVRLTLLKENKPYRRSVVKSKTLLWRKGVYIACSKTIGAQNMNKIEISYASKNDVE